MRVIGVYTSRHIFPGLGVAFAQAPELLLKLRLHHLDLLALLIIDAVGTILRPVFHRLRAGAGHQAAFQSRDGGHKLLKRSYSSF